MFIRFTRNRITFIINYCPKYVELGILVRVLVNVLQMLGCTSMAWVLVCYSTSLCTWLANNIKDLMVDARTPNAPKGPQRHKHPFIILCHNGRLVTAIMCGIWQTESLNDANFPIILCQQFPSFHHSLISIHNWYTLTASDIYLYIYIEMLEIHGELSIYNAIWWVWWQRKWVVAVGHHIITMQLMIIIIYVCNIIITIIIIVMVMIMFMILITIQWWRW